MARTPDKPLVWLHGQVKTPPFSSEARVEAGFLLRRLQRGETPGLPASRPMPAVGRHGRDAQGRARYVPAAVGVVQARGLGEATMKATKRTRLVRAGWQVGTAAEFLGLTPEEQQFVELKLALAGGVREFRERQGLTQAGLAKRLGSSQSRIAKMEAADASVSLDLLMRSLLSIGATAGQIAKLIKKAERRAA